jgi:hippurate hydrolase
MKKLLLAACIVSSLSFSALADKQLMTTVAKDYDSHLKDLFVHFHQNPELSMGEVKTAARIAKELKAVGFKVHEKVGKTGIVAILKNGKGPMVMMRADMDGLPMVEDSGLSYQSKATQKDPITGKVSSVMHGCGHDVHITSLVGTARHMAAHKSDWSGTLMLIGQPAEERIMGARIMMEDNIWRKFGKPDYALAFHVGASIETGRINVNEGPTSAGSNTVDIIVHGVGTHGAYPHKGKDPIVLGSQIVMALQTLVSRELPPKSPGVVTVGAFNSGTKHNIISDKAHLQLTVRNTSLKTRDALLSGIKRIAENLGRAAGLPEDKLPEVIVSKEEGTPPTINDVAMTKRLKAVWRKAYGNNKVTDIEDPGMGAEDFSFFITDPLIPSVYWTVGGTPQADFDIEKKGGTPVPSHHSPFFKIDPDKSVPQGVESTVLALMELMGKK